MERKLIRRNGVQRVIRRGEAQRRRQVCCHPGRQRVFTGISKSFMGRVHLASPL